MNKERKILRGIPKDDTFYKMVINLGLDESATQKDLTEATNIAFNEYHRKLQIKALGLSESARDEEIDKAQKTPEGGRLVRRAMLGGINDEELTIFEEKLYGETSKDSIFTSEKPKKRRRKRLRKRKCSSCREEFRRTGKRSTKCTHAGIVLS